MSGSNKNNNFYAAVDLGSNSFHLLVVETTENGMRIRNRVKQKVRLASGLSDNMILDEDSLYRGWRCLEIFAQQLQSIPSENIVVVATATLRLAKNSSAFLQKGSQILGHKINVISGEDEAKYIFNGVTNGKVNNLSSLVIDIGGASTEIAWGIGTKASILHSINMGCVTWMNNWFVNNQLNQKHFNNAVDAAKQALAPILKDFKTLKVDDCLGASGTPQAVIEILKAQSLSPTITLTFLNKLAQECCSAWHLDNLKIHGLQDSRRAIFPAGLAILIALFESLDIKEMHLAQGALREGILAEVLPIDINRDREKLLRLFNIDKEQAHRVYRCCQHLIANCRPEPELSPQLLRVLENVCMLHEVGKVISFKNHQQHSRYLITNTNMAWLNFEEKELIANIVSSNPSEQEINSNRSVNSGYGARQKQISMLIRILRLATILCSQRIEQVFYTPTITINDKEWQLTFREGYLQDNPLLDHLLKEEMTAIKRVNWLLEAE